MWYMCEQGFFFYPETFVVDLVIYFASSNEKDCGISYREKRWSDVPPVPGNDSYLCNTVLIIELYNRSPSFCFNMSIKPYSA